MIQLKEISKQYQVGDETVNALQNVSLTFQSGEVTAIVGPSGCGKSTLLHIVGQLTGPTSGTVEIDEQLISHRNEAEAARFRNEEFGYLLQDFALVETDTVFDNVRIPLIYARPRARNQRSRVKEALGNFGISELIDYPVASLSGGQRQRVAMARAIINEPQVVLADEPTGALDADNGSRVFEYLKDLAASGRTVVVVTHDLDLAALCGQIHVLRDGQLVTKGAAAPRKQRFELEA